MRRSLFLISLIVATRIVVSLFLRRGGEAFVAHGSLPPPPSGSLAFSGVPSPHPFQKDASGALVRTVFETDEPGNTRFEVRDLLIPPRGKSDFAPSLALRL